MNRKAQHVDQERQDDQTNNSSYYMSSKFDLDMSERDCISSTIASTHIRHLEVAKLVPQILDGIKADQCSDKEPDQFNTSNTADAKSSHEQPEKPFRLKALILELVKLGPAENRGNGTAEEHRIEQDEPADGRVRVFAKNHERDEPHSRTLQVELFRGPIGHGHADSAKQGVELAHKSVVDIFRICLS